jgi:hypothetical protein
MKNSLVVAVIAVVGAGAVGVYVMEKPSGNVPLVVPPSADTEIPTPQFLFEHPDVFKDAELKCQHDSTPSSLYCTNVQKAESLRLADQYRRALQPKGGAK